MDDLRVYFARRLESAGMQGAELKEATDVLLTARSCGFFLYARFADDALAQLQGDNNVTLAAIENEGNFASGMAGVYEQYSKRFKRDCVGGSDGLYETVLGALVVARGAVPLELLEPAIRRDAHVLRLDVAAQEPEAMQLAQAAGYLCG